MFIKKFLAVSDSVLQCLDMLCPDMPSCDVCVHVYVCMRICALFTHLTYIYIYIFVYACVCVTGDDSDDDGKGKGKGKDVEVEVDGLLDADNSEADIAKLLGFGGFSSTKVRVKIITVHSLTQKRHLYECNLSVFQPEINQNYAENEGFFVHRPHCAIFLIVVNSVFM